MSSSAQIAANQANAQLSTGPKSAEGKAKSSLNAVSTGLTGRTVLLPRDDAKAYVDHMANVFVRWDPQSPEEEEVVQDLAQTQWRLNRVPQLEEDLYALGSVTFANMFEDQPEDIRPGLVRAHTLVTYGKRFDNLYLQESRLMRRLNALYNNLRELKLQRQAEQAAIAAQRKAAASKPASRPNGFEFSNPETARPEQSRGTLSPSAKAKLAEQMNPQQSNPQVSRV